MLRRNGRETERPGLRSVLENGARLAAINWVDQALRAVYIVLLARYLGPETYGYWAYGVALYAMLVGVAGAGFDTLMPLRLGADKSNASGYLGITLGLRLCCFALVLIALVAYAFLVETDPLARTIILMLTPALVGRGLSLWARAAFLAYERTRNFMPIGMGFRAAEVVVGSGWLLSGGDLLGVVVIHSVFWMGEGLTGLLAVNRRLTSTRPRFKGSEMRDLLRQGAVLSVAAAFQAWLLAGPLVMGRLYTDDMAALGQVAFALNVLGILVAVASAFASAALPVVSRASGRSDPRLARYGAVSLVGVLLLTLPLAALAAWAGGPLVVWLLGPEFAEAGRFLGPVVLVAGVIIAPTGYGQTLLLAGRRDVAVYAGGAGALVLVLFMGPAVQFFGPGGAIAAAGAAWGVRACVQVVWAHRIGLAKS